MRPTLAVLAFLLAWPHDASAGRRRFAWVWDTDTLPQRTVELEWWVWELAGYSRTQADLYAATVFGLTDTLELAVPVELRWRPDGGTDFYGYGLELRWRLASADPQKVGPLVPFVRVAVSRLIQADAARIEGDAALSIDFSRDLRAAFDVGVAGVTSTGLLIGTFAAGVSYALGEDFHVGVEVYGDKTLRNAPEDDFWIAAGPSFAFSWGRFWLSAALPIGLGGDAPDFVPRVVWATAF